MQGSSFWKTVAVVGVIGIGTLVIVEVGNNLRQQTAATGNPADAELEALVAGDQPGDQTVTPRAESPFDRLLAGENPDFGGSEPDVNEAAPYFGGQEEPPVDNSVQLSDLVEGPNPFSADPSDTDVTAVAANYQGGPVTPTQPVSSTNTVEPTAFVGDAGPRASTDDVSSGRFQPFQPGDEFPAAADPVASTEPAFEDFPAFQPDGGTTAGGPATTDAPAFDGPATAASAFGGPATDAPAFDAPAFDTPASTEPPAAADRSGDTLLFVNGTNPANARTADTGDTRSGPFYEEDNGLLPTPGPAAASSAPPFESFGGDSTPVVEDVPATSEPVAPLLDFGGSDPAPFEPEPFEPEPFRPAPQQPRNLNPDAGTGGAPATTVPLETQPFEPQPFIRDTTPPVTPGSVPATTREDSRPLETFQPDNPDSVPVPRELDPLDAADFPAATTPATDSSNGDLLPFSEDIPVDPEMPAAPGRTTIPDFPADPVFDPAASPRNDLAPAREPVEGFPATRFGNESGIEITPRPGSERRDLTPIPDFRDDDFGGSDIEIRPRDSDRPRPVDDRLSIPVTPGGEREFGADSPTRPADFGAMDRGGRVRNVAGVMRLNLVLQKSAPENATVGTPLDYRIFIRNEGDATAYDVIVEDEIPAGARVEGASPQSVRDRSTNNLIWKFAEVPPNETREIVVRLTPIGEGTLDGVATVRFKSRVKATTVITAPKLRLEMAGPDETKMGQQVAYRYIVTNDGSGDAQNVFIRTLLPQEGGLTHPAGRDLEYEIGTLPAGQQREIVLSVVAADAGEFMAQAEVSGSGGAKDQAAWRTNIVGAQLQIVRRGPKRRFVGRTATYENIVSNETNFDAVDAQVTEFVPEGMDFISATRGGQYDPNTRKVVWRINRLAPRKQELLQVELRPRQAGDLESVVTVFENAGIQSKDYLSTTVVKDLHNVGARMSQLDGPVAVGETFGFSINIDNRGTADATDVSLVIDVPREIRVDRAGSPTLSATLNPRTNQVQYQVVGRIEPNQQAVFELKLIGEQPIENGLVKASVKYRQMSEPLVVSESVTVYRDEP